MNDATLGMRLVTRVLRMAVAATILTSAHALYAAPTGPEKRVAPDKLNPPSVELASDNKVVSPPAAAQPLPTPTPAEQRCGVQIVRVAVTAAGGLVDLRLKILDAAKARERIMDPAKPPLLIPEGSEHPLKAPQRVLKNMRFVNGVANYILYPNVHSAVKPGTKVVVALADLRLDAVTAR